MGVEVNQHNPTILTGFRGGAAEMNRTGMPPIEKLDISNPEDRQRVFYKGIAGLGSGEFTFNGWWQPGGMASTLINEFHVAAINNPNSVDEKVLIGYENRIKTYTALMATSSMIQHSDGALAAMPNYMAPPEMGKSYEWAGKAEDILNDPAIKFPLEWIEDWAADGHMFEVLRKEKESPGYMAQWQSRVAEMLKNNPDWQQHCVKNKIASGVEDAVVSIATTYFLVEDLPQWCEAIENGYNFPDVNNTGIKSKLTKQTLSLPNMGVLPFDEIFWHGIKHPTDVLAKKNGVYLDSSLKVNGRSLIEMLDDALTFGGMGLRGKGGSEIRPSNFEYGDLKKYTALWDVMIGGSTGKGLADFSKVIDGVNDLCKLYKPDDYNGISREEGVGWIVGELLSAKILAAAGGGKGVGQFENIGQVVKAIVLSPNSTKEMQSLAVTLLGNDLKGKNDGLIASIERQEGISVWTEELLIMTDVLKLGIRDPETVKKLRDSKLGVIGAGIWQLFGFAGDVSKIMDGGPKKK